MYIDLLPPLKSNIGEFFVFKIQFIMNVGLPWSRFFNFYFTTWIFPGGGKHLCPFCICRLPNLFNISLSPLSPSPPYLSLPSSHCSCFLHSSNMTEFTGGSWDTLMSSYAHKWNKEDKSGISINDSFSLFPNC